MARSNALHLLGVMTKLLKELLFSEFGGKYSAKNFFNGNLSTKFCFRGNRNKLLESKWGKKIPAIDTFSFIAQWEPNFSKTNLKKQHHSQRLECYYETAFMFSIFFMQWISLIFWQIYHRLDRGNNKLANRTLSSGSTTQNMKRWYWSTFRNQRTEEG